MIFKGIELAGFKSFADKVEIKLDDGITAIVGPNGCGKSNFGDAIKWVLGEQSAKNMRAPSMHDVIFGGTEKRKSLSYCEVSLHFDNTNHFFNTEYQELVITRKLYRSGESEYLINRNLCRLKDIRDLFYDSGIGRDGYSIIGQGKVEQIISSKPEDRRLIFEEAAGIAKFKVRKTEAERKLERTRDSLTRLRDIIAELDRQLGPLKKQAETAKKYLEFRDVLKSLEINAYIYHYENMGTNKEKINQKIDALLEEISIRQTELVNLNQKYNVCMEDISSIDDKIKAINNEILLLTVGIEKQAGETKLLQERIQNIKLQNSKIEQDILNYQNNIAKNTAEKKYKEERKKDLEFKAKEVEQSSGEYTELVKNFSDLKFRESSIMQQIKQNEQELGDLNTKIQVSENRHKLLSEMKENLEGYAYAVKRLLKDAEHNQDIKSKILGTLNSLIKVPEKYEVAIEIALGGNIQNIVTQNEEDAKYLVHYLKKNQAGRATFLPITSMKPKFLSQENRKFLNTKGCYGIASDLIVFDGKITNVVSNLLGNTVVVENLDIANEIAKASRFSFKIVTLDGDVVSTSGSITGGSRKSNNTNFISRDREISDLVNDIANAKVDFQNKKSILSNLAIDLTKTQSKLEELNSQKNTTEIKEAVIIAEINTEINAIVSDFARIDSQNKEYENIIERLKSEQTENNKFVEEQTQKISVLLQNSQNKDAQFKLELIKNQQTQLEQDKSKMQANLIVINEQKEKVMELLNIVNDKKFRVEMELAKLQNDIESMQERIYEEYELTYETCLEHRKADFDIDFATPEIARLKKEISKLGYVNVNAIEDSKVVYERYEEMSTQVEDLEKAEADTQKVIDELAQQMSEQFSEKFNQINENFKVTFKELFGGGNARLELVGDEDVLKSGVDIVAEPPGKKLQNITLLSGGEKALTAIAILFAILKLKPMPFCLLDEIEAALDEANVDRFAQYLRRFAGDTQFIVITHRKPTMELADSLYGVTMEEKGVSRVVSVKLNEAVKNAKTQEEIDGDI